MGYWKSKVVPMIKKLFEKDTGKKAAAAETCKTFDDIYKEAISKEIEEKKTQLQPKVVETYEATSAELKALVKEPKEDGLKKHGAEVHKFLEELVKIEFPGSKAVCDASTNHGVTLISGPISFIFEKVSIFLPVEEKSRELPEEMKAEASKEAKTEEPSRETAKEIVEEKKEETKVEEKKEETKVEGKKEETKVEEKKEEVKSEEKTAEKKEEAKSDLGKKPEEKVEEKKQEVKVEEKKPEDQKKSEEKAKEIKKEEKVEEKKVAAAATTTSEPKKP